MYIFHDMYVRISNNHTHIYIYMYMLYQVNLATCVFVCVFRLFSFLPIRSDQICPVAAQHRVATLQVSKPSIELRGSWIAAGFKP